MNKGKLANFLKIALLIIGLLGIKDSYALGEGKFDAQPEWSGGGDFNWNGEQLSWNVFRHPLYGTPETDNEMILYCDKNSNKMMLVVVDENNNAQWINYIYGIEKGSSGYTKMFDDIKGKTFEQFYEFFNSLKNNGDIGVGTTKTVYSDIMHEKGVGDLKNYKHYCTGKIFVTD